MARWQSVSYCPRCEAACSFWHQSQNPNGSLLVGGRPMPLNTTCSEFPAACTAAPGNATSIVAASVVNMLAIRLLRCFDMGILLFSTGLGVDGDIAAGPLSKRDWLYSNNVGHLSRLPCESF